MYVVFAGEFEEQVDSALTAATLEQAFAQIVCRCGYSYHFESVDEGWKLVLTDVERLDCSPDPIVSHFKKREDAKRDLLAQAVDGRLKSYVALPRDLFERRKASAMRALATE